MERDPPLQDMCVDCEDVPPIWGEIQVRRPFFHHMALFDRCIVKLTDLQVRIGRFRRRRRISNAANHRQRRNRV